MARTRANPNSYGGRAFELRVLGEHGDALDNIDGGGAISLAEAPSERVIYIRTEGSDEDGDGTTEETAYGSLYYAHQKVPLFTPGYVSYKLNMTGVDETLPFGFAFPQWLSGRANGFPGFAVTIEADHVLASDLTEAEATITAGTKNTNADTGHFSVVPTVSKEWTPDALVGLFVYGTSAEDEDETGLVGVIHANDEDEIFITSNEGDDWTFPFEIRECSASLSGASGGAFSGMITANFVSSLAINGISIVPTDDEDTGFCQQGGHVWFTGCHLVNPRLQSGMRFHGLENCNIVNASFSGETYCKSSRISGENTNWGRTANQGLALFRGTVLDGCPPIQCFETSSVDGSAFGGVLNISNVIMKNSIGRAVYWSGGNASFKAIQIDDCVADVDYPGDAIVLRGAVLGLCEGVVGTGNAGVGIRLLDGAQCQVDDATTVTGVLGDYKNGDQAIDSYGAGPYSELDISYDPTAGAPALATGQATRLFNAG